jgi:hypothetical protein
VAGVVADDDSDELRPLRHEPAGGRVGGVADRAGDGADALTGLDAHVGAVVQDARDGGDRNARLLGHVADRGAPAHGLLTNTASR